MSCIFCEIVAGRAPSLYREEAVVEQLVTVQ
jgi:hypothetical protein